jgi:hypothetical protein
VDRRGVRNELAMPAGQSYRFPALSDDATRLIAMRDDNTAVAGLWWSEVTSGAVPERLTRGGELMAAWTSGGDDVVYSLPQPEGWHLLRRSVASRGETLRLFAGAEPVVKRIRDVANELVVFQGSDLDLWLLPLAGEGHAYPLMKTPEIENHARVSPNGRWIAFSSTDANETRVYVTTFPDPGPLLRASSGTGYDPQWRGDGRELYYIGPSNVLMAVGVETEAAFTAGTPAPLFDARFDPRSLAFGSAYAVAPNGERFLVAELAQDSEPHLVATLNWSHASGAAPAAR